MEQSLAISEEQIVALSQTIQQLESGTVGRRRVEMSEAAFSEDSERMEELEQKSILQMKEVRKLEKLLAEAQQEVKESKMEELAAN